MSEQKHTPERWQIGGQFNDVTFVNAGRDCVAQCDGKNHQANARLIATAPEMLEALKLLDASWTREFPEGPGTQFRAGCSFHPETQEIWRAIRAAIAKAEGRA